MEGAIKLIQFCMEQRETRWFMFEYQGYSNSFVIKGFAGKEFELDQFIVPSGEFYIKPEELTPEKADEIIQIINDRIAKL